MWFLLITTVKWCGREGNIIINLKLFGRDNFKYSNWIRIIFYIFLTSMYYNFIEVWSTHYIDKAGYHDYHLCLPEEMQFDWSSGC